MVVVVRIMMTLLGFIMTRMNVEKTGPMLTSDMGCKTVLVIVHYFLLAERGYSGVELSIHPLTYTNS